ncbi:Major facilitator superfamily domain-containing protein [Rhodotorula toruloides]|nr:Major facilitator superfamily domain-containing protein [Rhodotorula toruloides]
MFSDNTGGRQNRSPSRPLLLRLTPIRTSSTMLPPPDAQHAPPADTPAIVEKSDEEAAAVAAVDEKRLLRKLDFLIMPILLIIVGLQYYAPPPSSALSFACHPSAAVPPFLWLTYTLSQAVLNSAAIFGIIPDLHLSTTHIDPTTGKKIVSTLRYSTASSAFYWGFAAAVLPAALLLKRVNAVKTLGLLVLLWGVVVCLTVVCTSYQGLIVQRVFLGVLESSVSPGFVLLTTMWYKRSEQATRLGIWYSATGIWSSFSGLVNFGLGSAHGSYPAWKRQYLFAGCLTILASSLLLFVLPSSPATPNRFFSEQERAVLVRRTRSNMGGRIGFGGVWDWRQVKEAACDIKIYIFALMGAGIYICNGAVTAFASQIIKSLGSYSSLQAIALGVPAGIFTAVFIYFFTFLSHKFPNSLTILLPISCIPVIVGAAIIHGASWKHPGVPLFGNYLLATFGSPYVLLLALAASNVAGSTKKAITSGAIFVGYCVGNIVAPYTVFISEKSVKFRSTWIALYVSLGVVMLLSLLLRFILARENRLRQSTTSSAPTSSDPEKVDDSCASSVVSDEEQERIEREDLTDWENKRFRYTL